MNRWVYITISLLGSVLFLAELLIAGEAQLAFTILFGTATLLLTIFLVSEIRYYNRHNALLASFQFLLWPTLFLLFGNIVAPLGMNGSLIQFWMASINAISTMTSLVLLFPIYFLLTRYSKYYDRRYPGFVIRQTSYGPTALPLSFHLSTVILILASGSVFGYIDFMGLVFVVSSLALIVVKKILPIFRRDRVLRTRERRSFLNTFLSGPTSDRYRSTRRRPGGSLLPSSSSSERRDTANETSRPSGRTVTTRPASGIRSVGTSPSQGYRSVGTGSSRRNNAASSSRSTNKRAHAKVADPVEVVATRKARNVPDSKLKHFLPNGHAEKEDLKCMVCYEEFKTNSKGNVVICPLCKFPAHEHEFRSWLTQSDNCPRCNKEVRRLFSSSNTISASQYAKLIKKI